VTDLFAPEINCQPHYDPNPPVAASTCTFGPQNTPGYNALLSLIDTEKFDDLRVQSVINEIDGFDHTRTQVVGVPVLFGMNFQTINAAKKDSLGGGYADDLGTPNSALTDALNHTDASIGSMITELINQGLYSTTAIIITAKHGESSLDPSKRVIDLNSAIQKVLSTAVPPIPGIPATGNAPGIAKLTEKTAALIWLSNQAYTQAAAQVLTIKANEATNGVPINPGVIRAAVTITQIAPTILELLNLDPTALQAVRMENTGVLAGIKSDNGKSAH
jgi:hypothetical protein